MDVIPFTKIDGDLKLVCPFRPIEIDEVTEDKQKRIHRVEYSECYGNRCPFCKFGSICMRIDNGGVE